MIERRCYTGIANEAGEAQRKFCIYHFFSTILSPVLSESSLYTQCDILWFHSTRNAGYLRQQAHPRGMPCLLSLLTFRDKHLTICMGIFARSSCYVAAHFL